MRIAFAMLSVLILAGCEVPSATSDAPLKSVPLESGRVHKEPWDVHGIADGQILHTEHYRIYITGSGRVLTILPGFLEAVYDRCAETTGVTFPARTPMPAYLLATRDQWADLTRHIFGPQSPAAKIDSGGYTYNGVTVCWRIGNKATLAVMAHEAMHQYLHYGLIDRLPRWMDEALATTAESYAITGKSIRFYDRNSARLADLRNALIEERWLKLEPLLSDHSLKHIIKDDKSGQLYYAEIYALGLMLRTHPIYREGWVKLMDAARLGRLGPQATPLSVFQTYITSDLELFATEFRAFCRTVCRLGEDESQGS